MNRARSGFLLIIVAGITALLAVITLTFISSTRSDAEESARTVREVQARAMLAAACAYVQETSRLGWDRRDDDPSTAWNEATNPPWGGGIGGLPADPSNRIHEEAFGWVDVRDGQVGPKTRDYDGDGAYDLRYDPAARDSMGRPAWPNIGGVCRAPIHAMERPPWAVGQDAAPNPIIQDESHDEFGLPFLDQPDPPLHPEVEALSGSAARWEAYSRGDPTPRLASANRSWFRLYRESPATFIVTCGGGGTQGFADWAEVVAAGAQDLFGGSQAVFDDALAQESRLWYRIEWSPAVHNQSGFGSHAQNTWRDARATKASPYSVNQGGTIQFIQRLRSPPDAW